MHGKFFISPSILNDKLASESVLRLQAFPFIILSKSCHSLLACKVPLTSQLIALWGFHFIWLFAFLLLFLKLLSLSLTFAILNMICFGVVIFGSILFGQYMNYELPDVQAGFRKGRGTRDQIANICWIIKKAKEFQKNIYFCFIDYAKAFDCVDHHKS